MIPIHSIPCSVAQPLERGYKNYYSIIQGEGKMTTSKNIQAQESQYVAGVRMLFKPLEEVWGGGGGGGRKPSFLRPGRRLSPPPPPPLRPGPNRLLLPLSRRRTVGARGPPAPLPHSLPAMIAELAFICPKPVGCFSPGLGWAGAPVLLLLRLFFSPPPPPPPPPRTPPPPPGRGNPPPPTGEQPGRCGDAVSSVPRRILRVRSDGG